MEAISPLRLDLDWKNAPRLWGHSLHAICPYIGQLPPSLAHSMVCRLSRPGDVVADPFAGRGTLPLEACLERRVGVGGDLSPLAHLLTTSKVSTPEATAIGERLAGLRTSFAEVAGPSLAHAQADLASLVAETPPEIAYAFQPDTLDRVGVAAKRR